MIPNVLIILHKGGGIQCIRIEARIEAKRVRVKDEETLL